MGGCDIFIGMEYWSRCMLRSALGAYVPVTIVVYDVKAYHSMNGGARRHESVERERNADRDVARPGLGG